MITEGQLMNGTPDSLAQMCYHVSRSNMRPPRGLFRGHSLRRKGRRMISVLVKHQDSAGGCSTADLERSVHTRILLFKFPGMPQQNIKLSAKG